MRTAEKVIQYQSPADSFRIYGLGDTHRGHVSHNEEALKRDIETIRRDPNGYWYHLGDVGDAVFPGDKRFRAHEVDPRYMLDIEDMPRQIVADLSELFSPIAGQCLGIHTGNHDDTGSARTFYSQPRALADRLAVPYLGSQCLTRLKFKRGVHTGTVLVHSMHGSGGGMLAGAPANYLEKQMSQVEAHIHLMGHLHRKGVVRKPMIYCPTSGKLTLLKRSRIGVACGAYLDSYTDGLQDYVEDKGMAAWDLGMVAVEVRPEFMEFEVYV
jgi:hypothetical protein